MSRRHVVTKDYRGAYLVDNVLVAARHLLHASVKHCLMSQHRREPLVVIDNRHFGHNLAPSRDKLIDSCKVFAGSSIRLFRFAYHDSLHFLPRYIIAQERFKPRCRNGRQPPGNNLQGVGDRYSTAFLAVVYCQYPRHFPNFRRVRRYCYDAYLTLYSSHASGYVERNSLRLAAASAFESNVVATTRYMLRSSFFTT